MRSFEFLLAVYSAVLVCAAPTRTVQEHLAGFDYDYQLGGAIPSPYESLAWLNLSRGAPDIQGKLVKGPLPASSPFYAVVYGSSDSAPKTGIMTTNYANHANTTTYNFDLHDLATTCTDSSGYSVPCILTIRGYQKLVKGTKPAAATYIAIPQYTQGPRSPSDPVLTAALGTVQFGDEWSNLKRVTIFSRRTDTQSAGGLVNTVVDSVRYTTREDRLG